MATRKTRSKRTTSRASRKSNPHYLPCACTHTYCAIQKWYKKEFEKAGWMIVAHAHGETEKIACYKGELGRLRAVIDHYLTHAHSPDKKHDLRVMWCNLKDLIEHIEGEYK